MIGIRWVLVFVIGLLFVFGFLYVEVLKVAPTTTNATILNAQPTPSGIVITVSAGGNFYRIHTNATMLNLSEPVVLHFKDGGIEAVEQDGRLFGVVKFEKLKTLEKMPEVRR